MKKRLHAGWILLMALIMTLSLVAAVYAAEDDVTGGDPNHEHVFGEWTVTVEPTYLNKGEKTRTCECGATETKMVRKLKGKYIWIKEDGNRYYLDKDSKPFKGWHKVTHFKAGEKKWCYFTQEGVYIKSVKKDTKNKWIKADGRKFYFGEDKKPLGKGFNLVRGRLYRMNKYGAVRYSKFKGDDGYWYKPNKDGSITGVPYYIYKYGSFVYVDISDQKLRCYINGKLRLRANVVTGTRGSHDTPTGTFQVRSKQRNIRLVGSSWDVGVNYWMAFLGSSYGLHDATWRSDREFNRKTYLRSGSHGCINMRKKDAGILFRLVKVGTRVIVQP